MRPKEYGTSPAETILQDVRTLQNFERWFCDELRYFYGETLYVVYGPKGVCIWVYGLGWLRSNSIECTVLLEDN